ncbi:CD151 antigen-like [Ptychodera flava]|uniref:CD151 antigen-like n=1 Tax=Ptychodera flava TaxID=63121 RepID=UPI00396A50C4
MVESCGLKCIKALLFVFNFIFWLSGCALAGVGIWIVIDSESFIQVLDNPLLINAAYIMIGVGGFVLIVGFCGCCGALKESKCMLGFYFTMLLLIFLIELAAGILASIYGSDIERYVEKTMNETLQLEYGEKKLVTDAWDEGQLVFECCGTYGYSDYLTSRWIESDRANPSENYPESCCKIADITIGQPTDRAKCYDPTDPMWATEYMNTNGCVQEFKEWVDQRIYILGGVGIGIACLQLFGMILAICLCRNIRSGD